MAVKTDQPETDVRMWMEQSPHGHYYINLLEYEKDRCYWQIKIKIATLCSNAPAEVKLAVENLFKAMELHGLNKDPKKE